MGELLRELRGGRSRREVAEAAKVSASHLQKLEEARNADVTVGTVGRLAEGYGVSPLQLVEVLLSLDPDHVADWAASSPHLRSRLEARLGRRVVVEAELPKTMSARMDKILTALEGQLASEGSASLQDTAARMQSLVAAMSSMVVALEAGYERSMGGGRGLEGLHGLGESVRKPRGDDGHGLPSSDLEAPGGAPKE
jgi:transcriptional regulator with XRE-family HTH domain